MCVMLFRLLFREGANQSAGRQGDASMTSEAERSLHVVFLRTKSRNATFCNAESSTTLTEEKGKKLPRKKGLRCPALRKEYTNEKYIYTCNRIKMESQAIFKPKLKRPWSFISPDFLYLITVLIKSALKDGW